MSIIASVGPILNLNPPICRIFALKSIMPYDFSSKSQ